MCHGIEEKGAQKSFIRLQIRLLQGRNAFKRAFRSLYCFSKE